MELIGSLDCGSIIAELAMALAGLHCTTTDIPYLKDGPGRERLLSLNPLGQVPTLVLENGTVMTESAAIVLYVNDLVPAAGLLPPVGAPDRAAVLNRFIWLVAAIYPTFTYGDDPGRWTLAGEASHALRHRTTRIARRYSAAGKEISVPARSLAATTSARSIAISLR